MIEIDKLIIKALEELKEKKQEEEQKPKIERNKEIDTKKNQQLLIKYIATNNEVEVKSLLEKGINPNFILKDRAGLIYPLGTALTNKVINERIVKVLLEYNARDCLSKRFYEDQQKDLINKISEDWAYHFSYKKNNKDEKTVKDCVDINEVFEFFGNDSVGNKINSYFPLYALFQNANGKEILAKKEFFNLFKDIDFSVINFFIKTIIGSGFLNSVSVNFLFHLFLAPTVDAEYKKVMNGEALSEKVLLLSAINNGVVSGANVKNSYSMFKINPKESNKTNSLVSVNAESIEGFVLKALNVCEKEVDLKEIIKVLLKLDEIGLKENSAHNSFNDKLLNSIWLKVLQLDALSCVELLCEKGLLPKEERISFVANEVFSNNYYSSYGAPSGFLEKSNGYGGYQWVLKGAPSTSLLCYSFLVGASNCSAVFSQVPVLVKQMQDSTVDNNYLVFSKNLLETLNCLKRVGYRLDLIVDKDGTNPMHQMARTSENKAMLQSCFKLNQGWLGQVNKEGKLPLDYWDASSKEKMMSMIDDSALRSQIGRKGKKTSMQTRKNMAL